jgi:hypothetical protein
MTSDASKKGYLVIAGILVAMVAVFTYIWIEMREPEPPPEEKPAPKTEITQGVKESSAPQTQNVNLAKHRKPIKRRPLPQRDLSERQEPDQVVKSRRPPEREIADVPATGFTDNWMFKKGEDVEEKSVEDTEAESITE